MLYVGGAAKFIQVHVFTNCWEGLVWPVDRKEGHHRSDAYYNNGKEKKEGDRSSRGHSLWLFLIFWGTMIFDQLVESDLLVLPLYWTGAV